MARWHNTTEIPLGIGYYTVAEASHLLRTQTRMIRRWIGGYTVSGVEYSPLFDPQIPRFDDCFELGFRDLIELRFVLAFYNEGVPYQTIRTCFSAAQDRLSSERPFSTQKFRTDGKTIFLDSIEKTGATETIDLKRGQYVFTHIMKQFFRGLEFEGSDVKRWRPQSGRDRIIIDPERSFGQPIVDQYSIPTAILADEVSEDQSEGEVAALYEIDVADVRASVQFERSLAA